MIFSLYVWYKKRYKIEAGTCALNGAPLKEGYDCHNVSDGWAIVVYNPDQVLPFFVIEYTMSGDK